MPRERVACVFLLLGCLLGCLDDFDRFIVCTAEHVGDPRCPTDAGGCVPNCEGKPCGAFDGCRGTCTLGACPSGQRCVNAVCSCDPMSCPDGCCSQNQCASGLLDGACGSAGLDCSLCMDGQVCAAKSCQSCGALNATLVHPALGARYATRRRIVASSAAYLGSPAAGVLVDPARFAPVGHVFRMTFGSSAIRG